MRYEKYKPSGFDWIGDIPEHWEVKKLSYCFETIGSGTTPKSSNLGYYNDGIYNWLQTGDLNDNEIIRTSRKITQDAVDDYSTLRFYPIESIVIAMYGATIGKTGILKIETTTNQACCVLSKPKGVVSKYVFYWFNSVKKHIISMSYGGGQPNINQEMIRFLKIQLPLPKEQTAIANYLDRKTAEIEELISQKEQLLELYEEEKTALINQAVTKGLTADGKGLNDYVDFETNKKSSNQDNQTNQGSRQFKDSGIEWLGKIPEYWEVKKLKYVSNIVLGKMLTNSDKGNFHKRKYLRAANIEWLNVNIEDVKEMWFSNNELTRLSINENDLLVSEGGEVGRTCIWKNELEECYIQNSVHKITLNNSNNPHYYLYQFYLYGQKGAFDAIVNRISIAHLTVEKIRDIDFPVPSFKEQTAIVQYIETEISQINTKSEKTKKLIDLLGEYKQSLISEVVTGKFKVI